MTDTLKLIVKYTYRLPLILYFGTLIFFGGIMHIASIPYWWATGNKIDSDVSKSMLKDFWKGIIK
jgi:hypothetical protein